jgi:predicted transcriptional regulator of viral defense system
MKFEALLECFQKEAYFDYASVALLFREGDESLRTSLYRFRKNGRLVELRRGLYAFAELYRKVPLTGPAVAEALYRPSYLSERWALSFHGVIPEKTVVYTSVSPRTTKRFDNAWGRFVYRSLRQDLFSGYASESIMGSPVHIASPEKALMDLMYLEAGEWTMARMESMRFEAALVDPESFVAAMKSTGLPRLVRAAEAWIRYADESAEGSIEL